MADLSWRDAAIKVLQGSLQPMHYAEIAERVAELHLKSEFGATPAATVGSIMSMSIVNEGDNSPFLRVSPGHYCLRSAVPEQRKSIDPSPKPDATGLINAFGMYWARDNVRWAVAPRILGQQQLGSTPVDFCGQRGVYLLYDGRAVVYVGRTTDQPLGVRLRQHIVDRLNGRWNRFSWFGVYPVTESGALNTTPVGTYNVDMLIATMEALMIEGLEPPQNRKRGDDFRAVEFLQVSDPDIQKTQILQLIDDLKKKL